MAVIYEAQHFVLRTLDQPHVSRSDGGHIVIDPKIAVEDRTQLSREQAVELVKLTMVGGAAMKTVLTRKGINSSTASEALAPEQLEVAAGVAAAGVDEGKDGVKRSTHGVGREAIRAGAAGLLQAVEERAVRACPRHQCGERAGVADGKASGMFVAQHADVARDPARDHRRAGGHGLDDHVRPALHARGHDQHVGASDRLSRPRMRARAQVADSRVGMGERRSLGRERGIERCADDRQPCRQRQGQPPPCGARIFSRILGIDSARYMQLAYDPSFAGSLGIDAPTLEGHLLPQTYRFTWQQDEEDIIGAMVKEFQDFFADSLDMRARAMGWTKSQVLTLASIVEGEAVLPEERAVIAGVYYNRLRKRMRLEADPTIQFLIPDGPRRLRYSDLRIQSPYNTYLSYGLPPGPVNNPGKESILATLHPARHNYLFFVANGKGGHWFSSTYAQHLRFVRQYRRERQRG